MFKEKHWKAFRKLQTTVPDQFKKRQESLASYKLNILVTSVQHCKSGPKYGQNSQEEDAQCEPEPLA